MPNGEPPITIEPLPDDSGQDAPWTIEPLETEDWQAHEDAIAPVAPLTIEPLETPDPQPIAEATPPLPTTVEPIAPPAPVAKPIRETAAQRIAGATTPTTPRTPLPEQPGQPAIRSPFETHEDSQRQQDQFMAQLLGGDPMARYGHPLTQSRDQQAARQADQSAFSDWLNDPALQLPVHADRQSLPDDAVMQDRVNQMLGIQSADDWLATLARFGHNPPPELVQARQDAIAKSARFMAAYRDLQPTRMGPALGLRRRDPLPPPYRGYTGPLDPNAIGYPQVLEKERARAQALRAANERVLAAGGNLYDTNLDGYAPPDPSDPANAVPSEALAGGKAYYPHVGEVLSPEDATLLWAYEQEYGELTKPKPGMGIIDAEPMAIVAYRREQGISPNKPITGAELRDQVLPRLRNSDWPVYARLTMRAVARAKEQLPKGVDLPNPLMRDYMLLDEARKRHIAIRHDGGGQRPINQIEQDVVAQLTMEFQRQASEEQKRLVARLPTEEKLLYLLGRAALTAASMPGQIWVGGSRLAGAAMDAAQDVTGVPLDSLREQTGEYNPEYDLVYRNILMQPAGIDLVAAQQRLDENLMAGSTYDQIGQGVGSMVGFMGGGWVASGLRYGAYVGPMLMGAAVNSEDIYQEAKHLGASESDARKAMLAGAMLGTTEGLPVGQAFERAGQAFKVFSKLDDAAGGRLWSVILKHGLQEGGEEALQESIQAIGGNVVIRQLVDENRGILEDLAANASMGGGLGTAAGVILSSMGAGRARLGQARNNAATAEAREAAERYLNPTGALQDALADRQVPTTPAPSTTPVMGETTTVVPDPAAAIDQYQTAMRQAFNDPAIELEQVAPITDGDRQVAQEASDLGYQVTFVRRTDGGAQTPAPATLDTTNPRHIIVEAGDSHTAQRAYVYHEILGHALRRIDQASWQQLLSQLQTHASGELSAAIDRYMDDSMAHGRESDLDAAIIPEEKVAELAASVAELVANQRITADDLAGIAMASPTLWQRFLAAAQRLAGRLGLRGGATIVERQQMAGEQAHAVSIFRQAHTSSASSGPPTNPAATGHSSPAPRPGGGDRGQHPASVRHDPLAGAGGGDPAGDGDRRE